MNEYIGTLFQSRNQAHIFHLQTTSYAKHKALNKYYEDIIDVIDGLVEAYQGAGFGIHIDTFSLAKKLN